MKYIILMLAILACVVTAINPPPEVNATTLGAYAEWYYDTQSPINVPNGYPISFPYNGQVKGSYMSRLSDNAFNILYPGTYLVQFDIVPTGAAQLGVKVNGVPQPQCVVGNPASLFVGYTQLNGLCIITTTSISSAIQVYNPSGSTITISGRYMENNSQGRITILALSGIYSEQNITSPVFGYAHFYSASQYSVYTNGAFSFPITSVVSGGIEKVANSLFRLVNKGRYLIMYRLTGIPTGGLPRNMQACIGITSGFIPGSCNGHIAEGGQLINSVIYQSTINNELISVESTGPTSFVNIPVAPGGSSIVANSLVIIQLSNPLDSDVNDFDVGFFYTSSPPADITIGADRLPLTSGSGTSMSIVGGNSVKLNNAGYYMIMTQTASDNNAPIDTRIGSGIVDGSRGTRTNYNSNTFFVPHIIRTTSANSVIYSEFLGGGTFPYNHIGASIGGMYPTGPSMVVWRIA